MPMAPPGVVRNGSQSFLLAEHSCQAPSPRCCDVQWRLPHSTCTVTVDQRLPGHCVFPRCWPVVCKVCFISLSAKPVDSTGACHVSSWESRSLWRLFRLLPHQGAHIPPLSVQSASGCTFSEGALSLCSQKSIKYAEFCPFLFFLPPNRCFPSLPKHPGTQRLGRWDPGIQGAPTQQASLHPSTPLAVSCPGLDQAKCCLVQAEVSLIVLTLCSPPHTTITTTTPFPRIITFPGLKLPNVLIFAVP